MPNLILNNKKILITGSSGFIGSNLVKRLLNDYKDISIIGIDNMNDYYDISLKEYRNKEFDGYSNYKFIKMDLSDKDIINKLFNENKFDIVVNLAAQAGVRYSINHPDAYIESNIIAPTAEGYFITATSLNFLFRYSV